MDNKVFNVGSNFMRNVDKYLSNPDIKKYRFLPKLRTHFQDNRVSRNKSQSSSEENGFGIFPPIKQAPLKRHIERLLRQNIHDLAFTALTLLGLSDGSFGLHSADSSRS